MDEALHFGHHDVFKILQEYQVQYTPQGDALIRCVKPSRVTDVSELGKNPLAINRLQQICWPFISLETQDVKEQNSRRESQGRKDVAREEEKNSCSILRSS